MNPRQLTSLQGAETFPTWSPDGTRVAYMHDGDIWVTQLDGTTAALTPDPSSTDSYPSWSPDGTQIAFSSMRQDSGYFTIPAIGGSPRKVADNPGGYSFQTRLAWSPDSSRVAFAKRTIDRPRVVLEIVTLRDLQPTTLPLVCVSPRTARP